MWFPILVKHLVPVSIQWPLFQVWNPIMKVRWSLDCLIFIMGILSLVRRHLYTDTSKKFNVLPVRKWIFDNFLEFQTKLHKEVLSVLPYFSLVLLLFHWSWTEERHVLQSLGAVSIRKTVLPGMAIPMLKIRRPNGRLIFNMEIAIRR